jgi:hypothetical protein
MPQVVLCPSGRLDGSDASSRAVDGVPLAGLKPRPLEEPALKFEPGQQFRLLRTHGRTEPSEFNNPVVPLKAGSIGTVREVVPAETPGAHNSEEDAVVLEFDYRDAVLDENDEATVIVSRRAAAFAVTDFEGPDALFEPVAE